MRMPILPCLAVFASVAGVCSAQSLKPDEVMSSVAVRAISEPNPVTGTDGRVHLAYELLVVNASKLFITLEKVEAVGDGERGVWSLGGKELAGMTKLFSGEEGTVSPGGSAAVFMDVSFTASEELPSKVSARVTARRQAADAHGKPVALPADSPLPSMFTFSGADTGVGRRAVEIEAPLRGDGWLDVNGCCDSITSHRGAIMAVNGLLRVPERFAIDWVRLDGGGRVFTGDANKLTSYHYYGTPVHSVAEGVVVNLYDDADEQVPGVEAKGITTENIGGNMLVVDIGGGAYAFYAHLQKGSLKARLGEHVAAGQVIGLLGNTGNSTAPHLHFHVMDGPSPLDANGLPYVFKSFSLRGVLEASGDDDPIEKGVPARIDTTRFSGARRDQLPLNNQVVDFN
jgi:murein DD-endopeptidase MepM/ murein hydrolase activator NlpD